MLDVKIGCASIIRVMSGQKFCLFVLFYETSGLSLLLGKPAQREGARTGLEVLCEVLHPTLSRPERPDHNTRNYMCQFREKSS